MVVMLGLTALLPMALPASYPTVPMKGIGGKDLDMPLVGLGTWQYTAEHLKHSDTRPRETHDAEPPVRYQPSTSNTQIPDHGTA